MILYRVLYILQLFTDLYFLAICRLSQNIAGVTVLAFGNGAPDIFSSMAGVSAERPGEIFIKIMLFIKLNSET